MKQDLQDIPRVVIGGEWHTGECFMCVFWDILVTRRERVERESTV